MVTGMSTFNPMSNKGGPELGSARLRDDCLGRASKGPKGVGFSGMEGIWGAMEFATASDRSAPRGEDGRDRPKCAWSVEVGVPGLGGGGLRSTGRQFSVLGGGEVA